MMYKSDKAKKCSIGKILDIIKTAKKNFFHKEVTKRKE